MLEIETKLSTSFYLKTNGQTERINQELEQYLQSFVDHRQKNWLEWLVIAEFAVNNKIYSATKVSLFIANYERELRMETDIRRKEKVIEFAKRMKKIQEKARTILKKAQEEMKRQANIERKEVEKQKKSNKVMLSMKNLVFKERLIRKLVDQYVGPYIIDKVVSTNIVKL